MLKLQKHVLSRMQYNIMRNSSHHIPKHFLFPPALFLRYKHRLNLNYITPWVSQDFLAACLCVNTVSIIKVIDLVHFPHMHTPMLPAGYLTRTTMPSCIPHDKSSAITRFAANQVPSFRIALLLLSAMMVSHRHSRALMLLTYVVARTWTCLRLLIVLCYLASARTKYVCFVPVSTPHRACIASLDHS